MKQNSTHSTLMSRLANHANLPSEQFDQPEASLLHALWRMRRGEPHGKISQLTDDILDCFQALHEECLPPHESPVGLPADGLASVAYSVSCILHQGMTYVLQSEGNPKEGEEVREARHQLWRVAAGWSFLLAGDIESIPDEVSLAERLL